jgi:multiple sugar transport system ATP-binding protein
VQRIGEQTRVIARLPSTIVTPIAAGETRDFATRPDQLRYFDAATGLRTDAVRLEA